MPTFEWLDVHLTDAEVAALLLLVEGQLDALPNASALKAELLNARVHLWAAKAEHRRSAAWSRGRPGGMVRWGGVDGPGRPAASARAADVTVVQA